ncbi:hypothetical protein ACPPVU_12360 [Mucilaginibacter sp. McL0603]|uniref:hypothetical protein n=1 Tax=Mucilaginibacter sp. McL0603 TaxID=3415670 RepID=UPI003CF0432A
MQLETKHAQIIIGMLEDAQDVGLNHVVFELRPTDMDLQPHQLDLFDTIGEALDYLDAKSGLGYLPGGGDEYPVYYRHVDQLLEELKQANSLTNHQDMNRNNLENLKEELKKLGFKDKVAAEMEKQIEKGLPEFTLNDKVNGARGQVDLTLHFRQSGQSENYFFNKYEVALNTGKGLEEGQKYMVITPNAQAPGKNLVKSFENVTEAISFFKEQKGNSELAVGKDAANKVELAKMEKGKVNYVAKDFQRTFRTPAQTQTFFVERGRGFTAEQAANLIQGRSVFRNDLLNLGGQGYAAWIKLDMDSPKDRYQNYQTNQYHVPTYGFELEKVLDKYQIKELNDPQKKEALIQTLENGNRPLVTTVKEGQDTKLFMEAVPRYSQLNFFKEDGKPEKREQFLKEPKLDQTLQIGKGKEKEQEHGLSV